MSLSTRMLRPGVDPVDDVARGFAAVVCAASAGVHAALVPAHLHESWPLGVLFGVVAGLLGAGAVTVAERDRRTRDVGMVAGLLVATAAAYLFSRTTGLPGGSAGAEPVDGLGVLTTLSELAGATACLLLILRRDPR